MGKLVVIYGMFLLHHNLHWSGVSIGNTILYEDFSDGIWYEVYLPWQYESFKLFIKHNLWFQIRCRKINQNILWSHWIRKSVNSIQRTSTATNIEIGRKVQNRHNVIEYLNPFAIIVECKKRKLFHLSPGIPLPDEIAVEIINTFAGLYQFF